MDNFVDNFFKHIKDFFVFFYNKPYHLFFVGLTLLLIYLCLVKNSHLLITGSVLTVFSIVTIIEILCNNNKRKNNIKKYYNELQGFEKEIIETCLNSAILSYVTDPFDDDAYTTAIYSLVGKGFGHNISRGGDFIMYQEVYNQLSELKAKKK